MKKIIVSVFLSVAVLLLTACNTKEKLEKKAAEELAASIVEGASGGKIDVDIDGDAIKVEGDDGSEFVFGETEWPNSDLAQQIPKFDSGTVVMVAEGENTLLINLTDVDEADFSIYYETIKELFAEETFEMNSEGSINYGASNTNGIGVIIYYRDSSLSITVSKATE